MFIISRILIQCQYLQSWNQHNNKDLFQCQRLNWHFGIQPHPCVSWRVHQAYACVKDNYDLMQVR